MPNANGNSDGASVVSLKPVLFLLAVLVVSLTINVVLARRIALLEGRNPAPRPPVGMVLPPLRASDPSGVACVLDYDVRQPTVLYVFSPSCSWCARNLLNIEELARQRRSDYRFIGIALTEKGLTEYLATHNLGFPVYKNPAADFSKAAQLNATPQTIVVSPGGRVVQNWIGAYMLRVQSEVESFFRLKLPGVAEGKGTGSTYGSHEPDRGLRGPVLCPELSRLARFVIVNGPRLPWGARGA